VASRVSFAGHLFGDLRSIPLRGADPTSPKKSHCPEKGGHRVHSVRTKTILAKHCTCYRGMFNLWPRGLTMRPSSAVLPTDDGRQNHQMLTRLRIALTKWGGTRPPMSSLSIVNQRSSSSEWTRCPVKTALVRTWPIPDVP
jgi:hypothetical protein